jgi:tRNA threonylcarbamoyladenosine biosynthesis protein TsaE
MQKELTIKEKIFERICNEEEVAAFVSEVSPFLNGGDWLLLDGDLGAGKTYFSKLLCSHLGNSEAVTSPTFSLMNQYVCQSKEAEASNSLANTNMSINNILHLDLYRIRQDNELLYLGLEQLWNKHTLLLCEWPFVVDHWSMFFQQLGMPLPLNTFLVEVEVFEGANNPQGSSRKFVFSKLKNESWIL